MAEQYLEKNDPLKRAKNIRLKKTDVARQPMTSKATRKREAIPTALKRQVERCINRRWLEIHHLKPVAAGGQNG